MVELHWPRRSTFRDRSRDFAFTGPGTTEVPDDAEQQYRERGWQDPPEESEAPPVAAQEPEETEADADPDEAEPEESDAGFDAAGFVDDSWQSVTSAIESGDADGHLDAVQAAEEGRDGGPRDSVISSIEERQG